MKWRIIYFDRWAEGWYSVKQSFTSKAEAELFLATPRSWPAAVDSRVLQRAIHDSDVQILEEQP